MVLVSHDESSLAELCDSLVWLENGRKVMHGAPHKVLETYHEYDHIIKELSRSFGITPQEYRAHPENADPLLRIRNLRAGIRQERDSQIKKLHSEIQKGIESGDPIPAEEVFDRIEKKLAGRSDHAE